MITGYGRGWQEPKAVGWRRIPQMMREPATKTDWNIAMVVIFIWVAVLVLL